MNQRTGAIESTMLRVFGRRAAISRVERIENYRLVTVEGHELDDRAWTVGHIVQFSFGSWESRAYTPLSYDARRGAFEFLGYVHGNGLGSAWLDSLARGAPCVFVGPRAALNLDTLERPVLLFGDETSFSTAAAMRATRHGYRDVSFVFEVDSPESAAPVLERFGLADCALVHRRQPNDAHLDAVEGHVLEAFRSDPAMRGIFTGKAGSIARLYRAARRAGISGKRLANLAYWAPGRKAFSGVQR